MSSAVASITFDCANPFALAEFWSKVMTWPLHSDPGPDDAEIGLTPPEGHPYLLFIRVPEGKVAEPRTGRRMHLDVMPIDRTRDEEVEWLKGIGATEFEDHREADGTGWVTMADPEGNLFCVERSVAERVRG